MEMQTQDKIDSSFLGKNSSAIYILGSIIISFGILLVLVGGSWDISNHLLNKPETFFSPPHALLYAGVAIALIGSIISFIGWRNLPTNKKRIFVFPIRIGLLGLGLLIGAGPFDFVWHSNFGLDGLLSPPHLTLIAGTLLTIIGSMTGIARYLHVTNLIHTKASFLITLGIVATWLAGTGIFYSFSLPFSNTDYFEFNPDTTFAIIFASMGFPFLISFILILSSGIAHYRFGILTVTGLLFLAINGSTSILTNSSLLDSIPFYVLNVIPIFVSDILISLFNNNRIRYISGAILGSSFYMIYFPLIVHTFNESLTNQIVWASLTSKIYFELIDEVMILTIIPAIGMGILGAIISMKIIPKLVRVNLQ